MMRSREVKKTGGNSSVMEFIKRYGLIIILFLFGVPYLYRYYVDAQRKDNQAEQDAQDKTMATEVENPVKQQEGLNQITTRTDLQDIARNVAYHFGTNVQIKDAGWGSWFNPRGWSENDEKAYLELKKINYASSRDLVVKAYYYLTQRNLLTDVKTLLDDEYKQKLSLFK